MKFGVTILTYGPDAGPDSFLDWTLLAERLGFGFGMVTDHVTSPPQITRNFPPPFYEPFATLSWLTGQTSRIELGTTVTVLPYRHPLHTARTAATIDRLGGGRLLFGVGTGWSNEEYAALGLDFTRRGAMTDEYLAGILDHWRRPTVSHEGGFAAYRDISTAPAPLRQPPVWVGGLSDAALRRTARFGDAWHPFGLGADELRDRLPALRDAAKRAGRDDLPAVTPRIALHVTDRPVDSPERIAGHGTVEQIRQDVGALAAIEEVTHILLDPFLAVFLGGAPAEPFPANDPALLRIAAEEIVDPGAGTVR